VGDHAFILDRELKRRGKNTGVIVYRDLPTGEREGVYQGGLKCKNLTDIIEREKPKVLLLHYVCYGFQDRGVPIFLPFVLSKVRKMYPKLRLWIFFHELNAFGAITSSAFWLSGLQLKICKDLYRLADQAFTNCDDFLNKIKRWKIHDRLDLCEVFSNLGEPDRLFEGRKGGVLLGAAQTKEKVFSNLGQNIHLLKSLGLNELVDIGSKVNLPSELKGELSLNHQGILPEEEVSALLSKASYGILCYEPGFLGKSGVYAAYLAHGCRVINLLSTPSMLHQNHLSSYLEYSDRNIISSLEKILSHF
jgi:hypothetical protein